MPQLNSDAPTNGHMSLCKVSVIAAQFNEHWNLLYNNSTLILELTHTHACAGEFYYAITRDAHLPEKHNN
jgi:hypothetical protein